MTAEQYTLLLSGWLRIPQQAIEKSFEQSRSKKVFPLGKKKISSLDASNGLISLMYMGVNGSCFTSENVNEVCFMSLEGEKGKDPLDDMGRSAFCALVGASLGMKSLNGYLNFSETVAEIFNRHRETVGSVKVLKIILKLYGTDILGIIQLEDSTKTIYEFRFTKSGESILRTGLCREITVDNSLIEGIAFVLSADKIVQR